MATAPAANTSVGTIKVAIGDVKIVGVDGVARQAQVGDRVFARETLQTGPNAIVQVQLQDGRMLDMGRDSKIALDNDVIGPQGPSATTTAPATGDIAALQAQIAAGADPSKVAEATAAGGAPGAGGADGSGGSPVIVDQANSKGPVTSGFNTGPAGIAFPDIEGEQFINLPPRVISILGGINVSEEGLVRGFGSPNPDNTGDNDTTNSRHYEGRMDISDPEGQPLDVDLGIPGVTLFSHGREIEWVLEDENNTLIGRVLISDGGEGGPVYEDIIRVHISDDPATLGAFTIDIFGPLDHPDNPADNGSNNDEDDLDFNIPVTATDPFGLTGTGVMNVNIEDDSPELAQGGEGGPQTQPVFSELTVPGPGESGNSLINGLGGAAGFGENTMFRNDDGSTGFVDVTSIFGAGGMNFFGTNYTGFYINNNGNITFGSPLGTFTPFSLTGATSNPMIAPFFADVDTRPSSSHVSPGGTSTGTNAVYWDMDTANGVITITWDDVGYFSNQTDLVNAFQLRIFSTGDGNFSFEFRYENVEWTTGGASGGSGGLGGTVARAGWNSGNGTDYYELPQSGSQGAVLDLENTSNPSTTPDGTWVFNVVNGQVVDNGRLTVTAEVREDGMRFATGDDSDGNQTIVNTNADEAAGTAGSLRGLYSFGADGPGEFTLRTDTSNLPQLYSNGDAVRYEVEGNVLTAYAGEGEGEREVFTLTLNLDGSWNFDLRDQLDHVDDGDNDENTALRAGDGGEGSVSSVNGIDLSSIIRATDYDGDQAPVLPPGTFTITVVDDIPVHVDGGEGFQPISATVQEDDMTGIAGGDLSTGNNEDGSTNQDEASSVLSGSLASLVKDGADEDITFSIRLDQGNLPQLFSNGDPITYSVGDDGHTLTASADGRTVFILTVNEDGSWDFDLQDQLDHVAGGGENNLLLTGDGGEGQSSVDSLDFSSVILVTDADGDELKLLNQGDFTITVVDDIPVRADGAEGGIDVTVHEDDMTGVAGGDLSIGNNEDSTVNADEASSAVSGSLASLVSVGADEPPTFSLKLDAGDLPQLYSQGDAVSYGVSGDGHTLTATADGRTVFTLTVNEDGSWNFDLQDQLDHVAGNGENTLLRSQSDSTVSAIDFSKLILVTDADGDALEVLNTGDFTFTIEDDVPVLNQRGAISVTVDEDDINTAWSQGTNPYDGQSDGSDTENNAGQNDPAIVTGSLAGAVSIGSDEPATYGFTADAVAYMQSLGLFSKQTALPENGQSLTYTTSSSGGWITLTATEPDIPFNIGNPASWPDTSNKVFELRVNTTTGAYEFRLFDELIHKPGEGENFDLRSGNSGATIPGINFGAIIKVTDADGDSITLNNAFTVNVRDDVPEAHLEVVGQSGVTHDESSGTQNNDVSGLGAIVPAALFLSVSNPGNDPHVADVIGPDVIGYAYSGTAVVTTAGTEVGADSPPPVDRLSLEVLNPDSGLMTTEGSPITLSEDSAGRIVGRDADGQAAFAIALDSDGKIYVVQYLSIKHPVGGASHDEEVNLGSTIAVQYHLTDSDGDAVMRQVLIGDRVRFGDDGPTVNVAVNSRLEASTMLTTQDAETDGVPTHFDTDTSSANFSGVFSITPNYGADGPGNTVVSYALSLAGASGTDSNLDSNHQNVNLYMYNGMVVGSTAPLSEIVPGVPNTENWVFTLSVDNNGVVTLTQFKEIDHVPNSDGAAPYDDQFAVLGSGLVNLTGTAVTTDGDSDTATDSETIDMGGNVRFADDGPSLSGQTEVRTVDEDDIDTAWSQGTSPEDGSADGSTTEDATGAAFVSGTLAGLVNSGADAPVVSYTFTADALTQMQNLHLYSKQSALPENGQELTYTITGPVLGIVTLTAREPDTAGAGDTSNPVFELKLNTATGEYEFRLFDELIHKAGEGENFDLRSGPGNANTVPNLNFGAIIQATDDDGDSVNLGGAFAINVRDDIPEVQISVVRNAEGANHDETPGIQNDDTTSGAVAALFSGVSSTGNDPDVSGSGAIGYARSGSAVVTVNGSEVGADSPPLATGFTLEVLSTVSGLQVTDGSAINLALEGGLIVGRVAGGAFNGQAAFAVAVDSDGEIFVAQYLSIQHPTGGASHDEEVNLDGKIQVRFTVTDSDGDTVSQAVEMGELVRFDDDGPSVSSNDTVVLEDDDLPPFGLDNSSPGDDSAPQNATGTLGHGYGADGAGSVLLTGATLPGTGGFSQTLSTDGLTLTITQGTTDVLRVTLSNATSGSYTVTQLAPINHPSGNNENNVNFTLNYRVTDGDGDTANGTMSINVDDDMPVVSVSGPDSVNEDAAPINGSWNALIGADQPGSVRVVVNGNEYTVGTAITVMEGSQNLGTLTVNNGGTWTFDPNLNIDNDLDDTFSFTIRATDNDGDTVTDSHTVEVRDGAGPTGSASPATLALDEEALGNANATGTNPSSPAEVATGTLSFTAGSDNLSTFAFSTNLTGLVQNTDALAGNELVWVRDSATQITGHFGSAGGAVAITLTLSASTILAGTSGSVSVAAVLSDNLKHALAGGEQVLNLGSVNVVGSDHDGDSATGTVNVSVKDDVPTVTLRPANLVDNGLFFDGFVPNGDAWGTGSGSATGTAGDWTITGGQLERIFEHRGSSSPTGSLAVDLEASGGATGNNVSISQTIDGLTAGEKYRLSFEIGQASDNSGPNGAVLEIYWNGVLVPGTFDGASGVMQTIRVDVTATGPTGTLEFREVGTVDSTGTYLANIRLTDQIIIDETPGIDADSDDTTDVAVIAQFAGVTNPGSDTAMASPQYAAGSTAVAVATPNYGADGPGTLVYGVQTTNGTDSGLRTTDGRSIILFQEGNLVVGRYDVAGGAVTTSDPAAFAIAINSTTGVASIAQYVSIQHPLNPQGDDGVSLAQGSVLATATVTDSDGDPAVATTNISGFFRFEDDGPRADNDTASVTEDTAVVATGNVLTNDASGADDPKTFVSWDSPLAGAWGTLVPGANGAYTYNLNNGAVQFLDTGETRTDTFNYTMRDADGDTRTATLTVTINGSNDIPTITTDSGNPQGANDVVYEAGLSPNGSGNGPTTTTATGTFTVADADGLDDVVSVTINGNTFAIGSLVGASVNGPNGTLTVTSYNPATGVAGYSYTLTSPTTDVAGDETNVFTLTTSDGTVSSAPATITIVIVDDLPTANPNSGSVTEDGTLVASGNVLTNDTSGADTPKAFHSWDTPATSPYGTVVLNPDGSYTYTLNNSNTTVQALDTGETLTQIYNYTMKDADGDQKSSTLTITINGTNDIPTITTNSGEPQGANDMVYEAGLSPNGSGNGPTTTLVGGTFTVSDADGLDDIQSVTINSTVISIAALQNSGVVNITIPGASGTLTVTGYSAGVATYTYQLTSQTTDVNQGATPETDVFTLTTSDGTATSAPATITIEIIDDLPTAVVDGPAGVTEDGLSNISGNVLTNDVSGADTPKSFVGWGADAGAIAALNTYGTLTQNASGTWSYVLDNTRAATQALTAASNLSYTLNYTMRDADGDQSSSTLTITITGANDSSDVATAAATGPDSTVYESGLNPNGSNAAANTETTTGLFTVSSTDGIANVVIGGTTFTLAQVQAFNGTQTVNTGQGVLTLTGYTGNSFSGTVNYSYTLSATIDNDSIVPTGNDAVTPAHFDDSVTLTVNGIGGTTDSDQLVIRAIDDTPTANNDVNSMTEDNTSVGGNVLGDGVAPQNAGEDVFGADRPPAVTAVRTGTEAAGTGTAGTLGVALAGTYGTLTLAADGSYTYTRTANLQGLDDTESVQDVFTYTMRDADGDTDTAQLTITINGSNDAPATNPDTNWALEAGYLQPGTQAIGNVLQNQNHPGAPAGSFADVADTDVDMENLTVVAGTFSGTYGTLVLLADGSYTYTVNNANPTVDALNPGQTLTDTFTYQATDGTATVPGQVTITIFGTTDYVPPRGGGTTALTVDEAALDTSNVGDLVASTNTGTTPASTDETDVTVAGGVTTDDPFSFTAGSAVLNVGFDAAQAPTITGMQANYSITWALSGSQLVGTLWFDTNGPTAGGLVSQGEVIRLSLDNPSVAIGATESVNVTVTLVGDLPHITSSAANEQITINGIKVVANDGTTTLNANVNVAVINDEPLANNDTDTVQSVAKDFNVAFVLDFSGSINNTELNTMLLAVKAAAQAIFNNPLADDVTMKIVAFSSDSTAYPSGTATFSTYAAFAAQIDLLNPAVGGTRPYSGSTDFTDAIQETIASFVPVSGASNQVFFISDGNPNEQTGTGGNSLDDGTATNWNNFVDNNDINVTTVGVGDGINSTRLQDVDVDGAGSPVLVANFSDLVNTLLSIVNAPIAAGNVITGVDTTSGAAGVDVSSADGGTKIAGVSGTGGSDFTPTAGNFEVTGTHGTLVINEDGSYTYTRSGTAPLIATDVFTYTLKDGDGDTTTATLTINIADNGVSITKPPQVGGADVTVDEDDLLASRGANEMAGSDPVKESTTQTGTFTVTAPDGVGNLSVGGLAVVVDGVYQGNGINTVTPLGNTLTIVSYIAGIVTYSYTLNDNETHPNANGENSITEDLAVSLTDADGDTTSATLTVKIVDDVPVINSVTNLVAQNNAGIYVGNWVNAGADGYNANVSGTNTNSAEGINLTLSNLASITLIKATGTEDKFDGSGNYLGEMYTAYLDVAKTQTFFTLYMRTNGTYEFNLVQPNPPVTTTETIDVKASIGGLSGDLYLEQITEAKGLADPVTDIKFTAHYGFVSNSNLGTVSNVNTSANGLGISTSGDGGGGIAIKQGESMTLTFLAGDADTDGDTHPTTPFGVDSVAIGFDTSTTPSGGTEAEVRFILRYTDSTTQEVNRNVSDGEVETVTAAAGKKIASVDVVNMDDDGETYLITSASTTITKTTLPADLALNFNVQVVDADGDVSSTVPFSVTIDTNNDLRSSAGNDILYGETGVKDTFSWNLGDAGVDTVVNFSNASASGAGTGDVLNLKDLLVGESHVGTNPGNLGTYLDFSLSGGNTVVDVHATGGAVTQTIVLQGVDLVTGNTEAQIITNLLTNNKLITD